MPHITIIILVTLNRIKRCAFFISEVKGTQKQALVTKFEKITNLMSSFMIDVLLSSFTFK